MAQTVTKTPDYYRRGSGSWTSSNVGTTLVSIPAGYRVDISYPSPVTSCSLKARFTASGLSEKATYTVTCTARGYSGSTAVWTSQQSFSWNMNNDTDHTFSFSGLSGASVTRIEYTISADSSVLLEQFGYTTQPTASYTYNPPTLGLSVSPSTVYTGGTITGTISEIFGQTISVKFLYNSTTLESFSTTSDSFSRQALASWFTTAGVSGNSLSVTVSISDSLGRSASARVTVNKPTGGTAAPTAPSGTTESGTGKIAFSWTYSGDGSQSKAELQYKTSSGTWQSLASVTTARSYSAAAWTFPVGSIQWRVRVYNSYGYWSAWSSAASFTVSYPALSVSASPATVYVNESEKLTFTNRSGRTLTVIFKQGSTVLYSTNTTGDTYTIAPPASWFDTAGVTGNTMTVTATISDSYGRTASTNFTLKKPAGRTATANVPSGTTVNGAESFNFSWTSTGDGTQTRSQLQWSRDQVVYTDYADITDGASVYAAPAVSLPGGTIYWRVRVYSSFGLWGEWSAAKSFTVKYDAVSQVIPVNSPTSGVYNAAAARVFSVALQASGPVYEPFTISAATMYLRAGESGDFTALTMSPSGNTASVTVPAGTFPSGRIEWYASATDTTGRTTETQHFVLTALQTEVEAAPASPINTVESGTGPILFRWTYNSLDGSTQSNAELQYSEDGTEWVDFATVTGSETTYAAPAGTFPGGTIYWRVRSYNSAGTAGPWSAAVTFVSFAAPVIQSVTGDGKPFATISWQVDDQMSYELEVNGVNYGPYFGEDARSFTLPEPLDDGTYTVAVRAQNRYGLWSVWATAEMSVVNEPSNGITLSGEFSDVADLTWALVPPPTITKQPESVVSNDYVGVSVEAVGENLSYQWQSVRQIGSRFVYNDFNGLTGGTSQSMAVKPGPSVNTAAYRCVIKSPAGTTISETVTWTRGESSEPPKVLYTACVPDDDNLHVYLWFVANGWTSETVYQRSTGSDEWHVYTTAGGAARRRLTLSTWAGREFYAVFSNEAGTTETEIIKIPAEMPEPIPDTPQDPIPDTTLSFVYRDGKRIGAASNGHFVDRTALGAHEYRIIKDQMNGYYNYSNTVTGTLTTDCPQIGPLDGGEFIPLPYVENYSDGVTINRAVNTVKTQFSGAKYPTVEIGEGQTYSASLGTFWLDGDTENADKLEALLGQAVIFKTPQGRVLVGVLDRLPGLDLYYKRAYTISVEQMEWRDFIDELS